MEKFLVTGANCFVGSGLCEALLARDLSFVPCVRQPLSISSTWPAAFASGGLSGPVDWTSVLTGCSVVIHLAARVHMMRKQAADPDAVY